MTNLSEIMALLQKNIDINESVWNSVGDKVYTQVLQWVSDLQDWNRADVLLLGDCVYNMEVSV
jgi:archaellum component FlaF (FlaF/FlaG flagellin family)